MGRRERWALGVALLVALAVMIWFVRAANERVAAEPVVPPRAVAISAPELPIEPLSAASAEPGATAAAHGPDEIELCGGVWVKATPGGEIDFDDLPRAVRLPEVRARLVDELRAAPDEFARAAGLAIGSTGFSEAAAPREAEFNARRNALARMAATTRDPRVYALAFYYCRQGQSADAACQLLNAEQWARLDPGNAAPWLFMLEQDGQRRDAVAQAEALHRIATSTRSEQYYFDVPGVIMQRLPDDEPTKAAVFALVTEAIGVSAAFTQPSYQPVFAMCGKDQLRDSNRRQSCSAAAELLVERSNTLIDRLIGNSLGQRLDWPAERTERVRGEYTAHQAAQVLHATEKAPSGCEGITHELDAVRRYARIGEVGALREWVKQSGKTADDFIRIERKTQATRVAEAASAASAASAEAAASAASAAR